MEPPQNRPVSHTHTASQPHYAEPAIQQNDFLEIMRALQQNMIVINQRLDGMSKPSLQVQSNMQTPQPVTQNVWSEKKNLHPQSQVVNQMIPLSQVASHQYC